MLELKDPANLTSGKYLGNVKIARSQERARIEEDKLDGRQEAALHRFGTQSIRWAAVACAA